MRSGAAAIRAPEGFYPPRIVPPARPPASPGLLVRLLIDSIRCIPESAYHEPIVVLRPALTPPIAYVTDPELIRIILLDRRELFPKPELQRRALAPLAGTGLLLAEGKNWRWQRQATAPVLRQAEVLSHVPAMIASAEALIDKWRSAPAGSVHAIDRDMVSVTYDVMTKTILPRSEAATRIIADGYAGYFATVTWTYLYALLRMPAWMPRPGGRAMAEHRRTLRGLVGDLVRSRRATPARSDDLLARLLDAPHPETGETMSDEQLVDNLLTFLIAGHDTTAKTLTWTLYLVANAPQWEARILAEIERVVPSGPITGEHIDKLKVTQQVVKESLRLFPSFPETSRVALQDVELGGHSIRAGTFIDIPIYALHRHRKLWDDPDRFDPGRFDADKEASYSRYQFLPFGAGPRVCVGAAFALTQATALLATFLRAAHFECPPHFVPEPVARLALLPRTGMPLRVTMRNCRASARSLNGSPPQ